MTHSIRVSPSHLQGSIFIPPSKSLLHRALICASLANGNSVLHPFILSDDIQATLNGIEALGATYNIIGQSITISGVSKVEKIQSMIDVYESATTLRFMIPIVALGNNKVTFRLGRHLANRPQTNYKIIFGKEMEITDNLITIYPPLTANNYTLESLSSSQFVSGLMFALPLLKENSTLSIETLVSKPYIDLTLSILDKFGITIEAIPQGYFISGNQAYKNKHVTIEGDYSQAAFFLGAGLFHPRIEVKNLALNSLQGDRLIVDYITKINGKIIHNEDGFTTHKSLLKPGRFSVENTPDLAPILALILSLSSGTSSLTQINRLKYKESNRINSILNALNAIGANITLGDDELIIHGVGKLKGGVQVDSYGDHRIVMMLAIAGTLCENPIEILNAGSVKKSYPHFFDDLSALGGIVTIL